MYYGMNMSFYTQLYIFQTVIKSF